LDLKHKCWARLVLLERQAIEAQRRGDARPALKVVIAHANSRARHLFHAVIEQELLQLIWCDLV